MQIWDVPNPIVYHIKPNIAWASSNTLHETNKSSLKSSSMLLWAKLAWPIFDWKNQLFQNFIFFSWSVWHAISKKLLDLIVAPLESKNIDGVVQLDSTWHGSLFFCTEISFMRQCWKLHVLNNSDILYHFYYIWHVNSWWQKEIFKLYHPRGEDSSGFISCSNFFDS